MTTSRNDVAGGGEMHEEHSPRQEEIIMSQKKKTFLSIVSLFPKASTQDPRHSLSLIIMKDE